MVVEIDENGQFIETILGSQPKQGEVFQYVVKAGRWFGAYVPEGSQFAFVGCTVSPGFDFLDFELAERQTLLDDYPHLSDIIFKLTA